MVYLRATDPVVDGKPWLLRVRPASTSVPVERHTVHGGDCPRNDHSLTAQEKAPIRDVNLAELPDPAVREIFRPCFPAIWVVECECNIALVV